MIVTLFIIRILFMVVGCYYNLYILPFSDTVDFHQMGTIQFNLFFTNPHEYFVNLFHNPYVHGYSRVFEDYHSFWNNLRTTLIAKMISLFDFLSFKNFWINSLFFNFIIFFGSIALYKVFISVFPKATIQLILCIFLLPSALFFSTMIHRDGLILLSISMAVYHLYFFKTGKNPVKRIIIISLFFLLILFLRNFVFLALVPALIAWLISSKIPQKAFHIFTIVYLVSILLFFVSGFISSKTDFPVYVAQRQESFIEIGKKANSIVEVKPLIPTVRGFISNAPQAFNLSLMRPYLSKITTLNFAPFVLEIFFMEILFLFFLFFRKKSKLIPPIIYFSLFFSFSMLMIAGYIVPIIGAIVRYRSIYFIFLMIPIICYTDWQKIFSFFGINKKKLL